jgi:hypothetical protein
MKSKTDSIEHINILTDVISRKSVSSRKVVSTFIINIKQSTVYEISIRHKTNNGDGNTNEKRIKQTQRQKFCFERYSPRTNSITLSETDKNAEIY